MRRKDREVTSVSEIGEIINNCMVCRVAVQDKDGLYIVPLNFGYELVEGTLTLFFHSAKEGRKIDAIKENPEVCVEMDCDGKLKEASDPCGYGYYFSSVVGNGRAEFVTDVEEKKKALTVIMKHQTGKDFTFDELRAGIVCVFKITLDSFSAKRQKQH